MIQRIQTVYLAIATILLMLPVILASNFISLEVQTGVYHLNSLSVLFENAGVSEVLLNAYPIVGALVLSLFLSIYSIAQFKNRKFQIKLVRLALVIQWVFVGLLAFYGWKMTDLAGENFTPSISLFVAVPFICMILFVLAAKGIQKDDDLIRSADRLR